MIYRHRKHKSGYSLGFTKGRQFIKVEIGKRVWYIQYGMPVFWTMSGLKDIQDMWGQYTLVEHLVRKDRVTVDRLRDATDYNVTQLLIQAMR